jgi:DNA repair protein RadC
MTPPRPPPSAALAEKPHYLGHRERLRERLLAAGAETLPDYELLEFLLFDTRSRGDVKPLAKALIERFGGFAGVLGADKDALLDVPGMGEASAARLLAVRAAATRMLRAEVRQRPVIGSWQALIDYCTAAAGYAANEEFRLLFLDKRNALIAEERQQQGTVDHTPVYPREVAIIMVHNHPTPGFSFPLDHAQSP